MSVLERPSADRLSPGTGGWHHTVVEAVPLPLFLFRERILYANPACEELSGYAVRELLSMELEQLFPPRLRHSVAELAAVWTQEGRETRQRLLVLRKDGRRRWLELRAVGVELDGVPAALGTALDLTGQRRGDRDLRRSEHWFRTLAETTASPIFVYDTEKLLYTNRAAEELTGYTNQELLSLGPADLVHPDHLRRMAERIGRRRRGEPISPRVELKILTRGGDVRWLDIAAETLELEGRWAVLGSAIDVTERRLAEEELRREKERAQVTLASIGDGVIRTDATGRVDYLNPVAERLTGWSAEEAQGRPLREVFRVVDERTRKPLHDPVELCLAQGRVLELPEPTLLIRRDGTELPVRDTVAPLRDAGGEVSGVVLVFKDLSEIRGMEREMSHLARHDFLTGLLNRRALESRLRECLRSAQEEGRRHALCYLDLDEFKLINDTCGHPAGDELLRQLTALLRSVVREGDTLARLGSDEFGVLLEDTGPAVARRLAEEICSRIDAFRFRWQDRTLQMGTSIGLVPINAASGDLQEVLRAADAACYVAKEGGRNRIHEYRPDDRAVAERSGEMQWIHRIHQAFEQGRFELARQIIRPLAAPDGGDPLHEILIRMRDLDGRWITAGAFIPAAERYRLAPSIDRWAVTHAFRLLCGQPGLAQGRFTLNLSGQSLGEEGFLDEVVGALEASGLEPSRVLFEITETAAISHLAAATRFIAVLRGMGCSFVLDDFGSGLSSFAYLKNLAVDFLKIDREFVRDMAKNRVQRALVRSIHQVGREMGMCTIAEGVETEEVYEALKEIGVGYVQGYWIGRPVPLVAV